MLGNIETLLTNTSRPMTRELLPLEIVSKLRPVTPEAGTLVSCDPSPEKEPVNDPDRLARPSSTSSNLIEASADPSVRQTLKNLTVSNLTNPLSDTRVGLTDLMGLIKGGRFKSKYKGFNESGVKAASDFGKTWQKAPGFQTRFDDFTYQVNDPVLTRQVRNNQNLYNQGLEKLKYLSRSVHKAYISL